MFILFAYIIPKALENLRQDLEHFHPISQRKRNRVASLLLVLLLTTGITGVFTAASDRQLRLIDNNQDATELEIKKAHIVFAMCMLTMFFFVTLTLGTAILWFVLETYFYIHRRRVLSQATARVVRDARRRSRHLTTTQL